MRRYILWAILAAIVGVGILMAILLLTLKTNFSGTDVSSSFTAPDFKLTDHNGNTFKLSDYRGKVVLLFFGFTNCTDECPTTMAHIKLALEAIGPRAKDVQVIMVTTDPARDSLQVLKDFMGHFDPNYLGLSGTTAELEMVWKDYGVYVGKDGETHSAYLYVIDPVGILRETFVPDSEPGDISTELELLLNRE